VTDRRTTHASEKCVGIGGIDALPERFRLKIIMMTTTMMAMTAQVVVLKI